MTSPTYYLGILLRRPKKLENSEDFQSWKASFEDALEADNLSHLLSDDVVARDEAGQAAFDTQSRGLATSMRMMLGAGLLGPRRRAMGAKELWKDLKEEFEPQGASSTAIPVNALVDFKFDAGNIATSLADFLDKVASLRAVHPTHNLLEETFLSNLLLNRLGPSLEAFNTSSSLHPLAFVSPRSRKSQKKTFPFYPRKTYHHLSSQSIISLRLPFVNPLESRNETRRRPNHELAKGQLTSRNTPSLPSTSGAGHLPRSPTPTERR